MKPRRPLRKVIKSASLLLFVPLGFLILVLLRATLRIQPVQYLDSNQGYLDLKNDGPFLLVFWHDMQLVMPFLFLPRLYWSPRKIWVLISEHRDGRLIALIVRMLGYGVVAGSSTRGGRKAVRVLVNKLKEGEHIAITPDGPKGPRHVAKRGVVSIAKQVDGIKVIPMSIGVERCWRLKSWDKFLVPKPFSRITYFVGGPVRFSSNQGAKQLVELEEALSKVTTLSDKVESRAAH